ncbi:MAG: T9SS type A sorting domain-containing protein [Paludibacteraceae bacterium]|nr:T9SS type A sorting domain-containing protein [Paludibacteraceae bacterium]
MSGLDYVQGSGPSSAQTFTVSGNDLTANVNVTAPTNFEVSKDGSSYAASQTITASGTLSATTIYVRLKSGLSVNSYSGDIAVESTGATSKTVSLSGSVTAPAYTVSWSVNGADWTGSGHGNPSTSVTYNTKPSTIPTAPDGDEVCGGKVFRGWTSDPDYSGSGEGLFDTQAGAPEITKNTTFYAVFATASGGGWVLNEEFDNNSTNDSSTPITSSTFSNFSGSTSRAYKSRYGGIKLGTDDYTGHITSKALDLSSAFTVSLDARYFSSGSDNADINIIVDWGETNEVTRKISHDDLTSSFTNFSFDFAAATSSSTIRIETSTKRAYIDNVIVTTGSLSDYATTCCTQPATQLSMTADKTELVKSGTVNFTLTGGNGKNITWSCRDESDANCDDLLTSKSNSGATLTISSPVAATKTYTVKAVQPEDDDDAEVVCGKTLKMDITVKAQWTITFQTTDAEGATEYSHTTVTDGDTYTFPDLSDDYICAENYSFAGWKAENTAGAPEYAGGSSATASADKIWYAVWMYSTGTKTITRDKYELVTSSSAAIAEDDVVVIACNSQGVALAQMTASDTYGSPVAVDFAADKSYLTFASGTNVMELKVLNYADEGADSYYFVDNANTGNAITIANSSPTGKLHYSTNTKFWTWKITITVQNNATIEDYVNREYAIEYNSSNNRFAYYKKTQKKVQLYRKNGKVSVEVPADPTYYVNNEHCTNGATIRANGGQWITSAKDQKVRITVPVTAKNFATSGKQLTASSDNSHFSVSFPSHTIPSDKREVEVQMTVEYTPTEANTIEEANITITTGTGDGNATKVISVNGRSLPDEFVIVTQKEGKWQALPANMFSGTGTYSPMEVTPNGGITAIPAAPYTTIYSAREVASGRYESAGTCMRLVGNNNKCLWANNSSNGTGIQNFAALGNTNGAQYEWLLSTADGEQYTIANPAHPDYATGRQLGIYTLKYGLYKTTDIFYLLPVGCSSQPGNLQITPRRVDAMFSWETNAASVTIYLWTNEAMSEGHQQAVVTSVPYQFTGLTENTDYWYKITPGSDDDCAVTGTFSTTGPTIDVVEWGENSATIFVDKDEAVDPQIIIAGEVEYGQGSGAAATDIFFSKYFEAEGTAKMLAIYNGTGNAISLADITILHRSTTKNYTPLSLASYGKTAGWIQPGEEIILFNRDNRAAVMSCAESDPTYPSWNNVENTNLAFSGKGTIRLFRGNECIDIIGAMEAGKDINDKAVNPIEGSASPSFGDANGFVSTSGDNYATKETVENDYELSTNRCLLIRQNWVTSGDSAVLNNFDDFKTLGTYTGVDSKTHKGEWAGLQVPDAVAPDADYIHTCEGFQEVGKFDYNQYYREYTQIGEDKYLSEFTRAEDGTYTLSIGNMRKYACLNLKFQLTEHDNKANVLTEQTVQVPIVVKDARNSNDTLFNNIIKTDKAPHTPMVPQSIERCKTCNVVVLSTGTLTKATDGVANDVAEVRDVKVYPGGKLIVPVGTHYVINSLSLRRQEDEIASAKIDAGLSSDPSDGNKKGLYIRESNGVYLDVRIDPSNWHYFTLPYDCRVGDIRFSDGTPAKVNNDYLLSWYDGAYRAEHKDGGWTDITEEDYVLKKGLGYIVALPGEGLIKRELRFPMANEVISAELANKEVGGLYAYGGDKTDEELRPNHKGWNMIGNPYLYDYTTDIVNTPLATGKLTHDPSSPWNGQWVRTGNARYIVEPIDNGWTGYRQTTISNLKPFMSYFIQVGTKTDGTDNPETERNITFNKTSKASIARRNMPAEEAEEPMFPVWYGIEMTAPNAEKDNTTLLISDEFTDGYDMMDDLIKMRGSYYQYYPYPVLASRNNEGEMAFNALPDSSASVIGVPLNYYAAQAGTYTIRTDSRFDLEEVKSAMLYDATTNQYNDLLAGDYSFTTAKGDNTNRFKLFVRVERKKAPDVATGTDNILENGKLSLIAIDRTLVLSGLDEAADIYVYDMSGKLIKGERNAGEGVWRANVSAQGVYFVRVNSQSGQQTLRTIVK